MGSEALEFYLDVGLAFSYSKTKKIPINLVWVLVVGS